MHVKNAVKLRVPAQAQCSIPGRCEPLSGCLAGKALHLDIEELPEVTEPLNQLGCDTAIELDIREKCFECAGAGVACVKEHEFGFLQMARRETFLRVWMVKEIWIPQQQVKN